MRLKLDVEEIEQAVCEWVERHHPSLVACVDENVLWTDESGDGLDYPYGVELTVEKRLEATE